MISFVDAGTRLCDGITRRQWLSLGGLTVLGLGQPQLEAARVQAADNLAPALRASFGRAKHCIVLFMLGGPPQHETWDPKPLAPREIRGDFGTIPTATTGYHVGELMPRTAGLTGHIAVLRAMATDDNAHSSSGYWMLTGRPHTPKGRENSLPGPPNDWPCLAATVRHLKGDAHGLPGAIRLPEEIWNTGHILWPGQDAGWLGKQADPWLLTCDPNAADFKVPHVSLPVHVSPDRLALREALRQVMNRQGLERSGAAVSAWSAWQRKALDLLHAPQTRAAFDIVQESDATRDRYGRNRFGQSVLLARRLIESGVGLVQVNWTRWETDENVAPAWDTHAKNSQRLKEALMPPMDLAYSALLEDLSSRGLLDETLVVWMGEFGRSPKINAAGGRDHWGHVFSATLAGGGVQGGTVYGQSDRDAGYPLEGRVEPQDLAATIYHCLGLSPETLIHDPTGRPSPLSTGQPVAAIL